MCTTTTITTKTATTTPTPTKHLYSYRIDEKDYEYPSTFRLHPVLDSPISQFLMLLAVFIPMMRNLWLRWSVNFSCAAAEALPWTSFLMDAFVVLSVGFAFLMGVLPHKKRKQYFLRGQASLPRVDVLLPMCNEDIFIQQKTITSVLAMNYPPDKLRVFVLDDGHSEELKRFCQTEFGSKGPFLTYHRRRKIPGKPHHGKAGNLNFGMAISKKECDCAPYVMQLDADMMPVPNYLRRILPHLMLDSRVGIACPPQRFYNLPFGDPLGQDVAIFADMFQPRLDLFGCVPAIGHGWVMKRSAIEKIGGIPVGITGEGLGEDFNTSIYLWRNGFTVAHVHEDLQVGLQPDSFAGHVRQRCRWFIGSLYTAWEHGCFIWNSSGMTLLQRAVTFQYTYLIPLSMLLQFLSVYAFSVILLTSSDSALVPVTSFSEMAQQLRTGCLFFITQKVLGIVFYGSRVGLLRLQRDHLVLPLLAPYWIKAFLREFCLLPSLGGGKVAYIPAGQGIGSKDLERDSRARLPFWGRVYHLFFCRGVWTHALLILLTMGGIMYRSYALWNDPEENASALVALIRKETGNDEALPAYFDRFILYCGYPPFWAIAVLQHSFSAVMYVLIPPADPPKPPASKMLNQLEVGTGSEVYVAKTSMFYTLLWELPTAAMFVYCMAVLFWIQNW